MTVGNFTELLATDGNFDFGGFDSITGADLTIVYALEGGDALNSHNGGGLPEGGLTTILVGGSGGNRYQVRNNATVIAIENADANNILWTTILGSGIGLEKETSFVAEIDNRHLYLGDTASDQYVILVDWQQPENQIETFDLTEGELSYEEFSSRFRDSANYRGNLTWSELANTGEIDLERLGLSVDSIDTDLETIIRRSAELEGTIPPEFATIGNFNEIYGVGFDLGTAGFDSISGSDRQIIYGLNGDDVLNSTTTFNGGDLADGESTTILVGGSGSNNYQVRDNSIALVIENANFDSNILWTIIGSSGIGLEKETSFVAEIDNRHLYLGDTLNNQYVILADWQSPENQIETFALTEGELSYEEFSNRFRESANYRGNLTWSELSNTGEIDLERLNLSPDNINDAIATIKNRSDRLETGGFFENTELDRRLFDDNSNDLLTGGFGNEGLFSYGGRDTLEGNSGDDIYFIDANNSNGSQIKDVEGSDYLIVGLKEFLDLDFYEDPYLDLRNNPATYNYGEFSIQLSSPQPGIIGIERSQNNLIIDLDRDGIATAENDLTIVDFFDESGNLGNDAIEGINNIANSQTLVNYLSPPSPEIRDRESHDIYRFFNSNSLTYFYTIDLVEQQYIRDNLSGFFEQEITSRSVSSQNSLEEDNRVLVHRFFNRDLGTHFYTTDENEIATIQQDLPHFSYEGAKFLAHNSEFNNSQPIYRFYQPTTGTHLFSPDATDINFMGFDFQAEGIAYYTPQI